MSELVRAGTAVLENLAAEINAEHRACEASANTALHHAIRAGELLVEAKTNQKHGGWLKWLDENFEGSVSLANKYMQAARNSERVTNLNGSKGEVSLRGALDEVRQKVAEEKDRKRRAEIVGRARQIQEAGGLAAAKSRKEVAGPRWWVELGRGIREEIRKGADPEEVKIGSLKVHRALGTCNKAEDWVAAKQLERALVKDLEAVRNQRSASTPDLNDPRVVYEIGKRVLGNHDKRGGEWQRFAAFVQDGGGA